MFERIDGALNGLQSWCVGTAAMVVCVVVNAHEFGQWWPFLAGLLASVVAGATWSGRHHLRVVRDLDRERRELKEVRDGK